MFSRDGGGLWGKCPPIVLDNRKGIVFKKCPPVYPMGEAVFAKCPPMQHVGLMEGDFWWKWRGSGKGGGVDGWWEGGDVWAKWHHPPALLCPAAGLENQIGPPLPPPLPPQSTTCAGGPLLHHHLLCGSILSSTKPYHPPSPPSGSLPSLWL